MASRRQRQGRGRIRHDDDGDFHDQFEKFGKMRRRPKRTSKAGDLTDTFEKPESAWAALLGQEGYGGAFAARVVEVHKRYAFVSRENSGVTDTKDVWLATIARKFLVAERSERNFVAVGDLVLVAPAIEQDSEESDLPRCVILHMAPRRSRIARLDPHQTGLEHVLATNMDQLLIVASYLSPTVKWGLIDRYLVMAEAEGIRSIIVLNKKDLLLSEASPEFVQQCHEMRDLYRGLGYTVLEMSANSKACARSDEAKQLKDLLKGHLTLLSGHSGVGKSSLVNLFKPEIVQAVEPDDDIFYKGRHTTSFASFIKLGSGGYVIDTPGIRSFTFNDLSAIELSHCFVEMRPTLGQCRYRECRHIDEPGCLIRLALEEGRISLRRYRSYLAILTGASGREGRTRDIDLFEDEPELEGKAPLGVDGGES